jgi:hypothetical protein
MKCCVVCPDINHFGKGKIQKEWNEMYALFNYYCEHPWRERAAFLKYWWKRKFCNMKYTPPPWSKAEPEEK